ncbi:uncharacterized protein SCHCODRAFT_02604683 [Schizophyllum commune H4-8]|uniref:uncharacterized protein n=1 Tax=Schizophyllum commune (strain H4-8 / FGSC 9210) TaxID=578458 RepID=UPI00215ECF7B|nr:uncharacterized protein SCHCODRAFT_02604683 [Schizophyllum commune H4-8]KAI5899275.1 hypothetical protein SCHCODRAFT_02604683 [Schizophyllum commune H4-8]
MPDLGGDERQLLPLHELQGDGRRRSSKLELPDDVWINIMRYLKPLDIVALRQTSRRLKGPSLNRAVWMHALRVVVADNGVHPLTFPIDKMSTADLESAASCPQKLTRILLRFGQSFLAPVPHPEPVHRRAFYIKQEGDKPVVRSIRLLPGGRYLVVERLETVLIMDLGWRTEAVIRRSPIYILHKKTIGAGPTRVCTLEHLVWDQGNGNLRLFFVLNGDSFVANSGGPEVIVHEVSDILCHPQGSVIARLDIRSASGVEVGNLTAQQDCLAVAVGDLTVVWDYKNHSMASFAGLSSPMALIHGTLVGSGSEYETLEVYSLPTLSPSLAIDPTPASLAPKPQLQFSHFNVAIVSPSLALHLPHDCYEHATCFLDNDLCLIEVRSDTGQLTRYVVEKVSPKLSSARAAVFKIAEFNIGEHSIQRRYRMKYLRDLRVCDDGIVTGVMKIGAGEAGKSSAIYVHIASKGGDDAPYEDRFEATKRLLGAEDCGWREWDTFDFCPISGRLCTIVGSYVSVFDYVPCLNRTE